MPIMFNEIKITLHDPPGGAYCAGETISGEMKGWNILLCGVASVSFAFIVGFVELNIRESNTNARGNTSCWHSKIFGMSQSTESCRAQGRFV